MRVELPIYPRTIGIVLIIVSLYLAAQSIFGEYVQATALRAKLDSIPAMVFDEFSVNSETTIPSWFSATILLVAGLLLALIAAAKYGSKAKSPGYWLLLATIFVYLSIDEGAAIHEILSDPIHTALHTSGFLEFGWQLAIAPLLIIFGLMYLKFLFYLPPRFRGLFILCGAIYVGGAFFGDAVQANVLSIEGGQQLSLLYLAIGTVEELMEMVGIALFIYTLLAYMLELHYSYAFYLPSLPAAAQQHFGSEVVPVNLVIGHTGGKIRRLAVILLAIIVLVNAGLLFWGISLPPSESAAASDTALPAYEAIISQYSMDQMTVVHVNGVFSKDNQSAIQVVAFMLNAFSQVMVVSLPGSQSSIVLAGPYSSDESGYSGILIARERANSVQDLRKIRIECHYWCEAGGSPVR
jgi:hypothetical protein